MSGRHIDANLAHIRPLTRITQRHKNGCLDSPKTPSDIHRSDTPDSAITTRWLTSRFIDRGGTFTDCIARVKGQDDIVIKILSVDPRNYADAPTEAIRQVLERFYERAIPRGTELELKDVGRLIILNIGVSRN